MNWEIWGPPLVVLALGLVAGVIVVMRSRGGTVASETGAGGLTRDDLQTRKDALVEELRGLEAERSKVPADQFAARWQDTLDRAASALRDLDNYDLAPHDTEEIAVEAARSADGVAFGRAGWAAAVVVFFVVLGLTLSQGSKPRTGDAGLTGATVNQRQARLEAFEARLEKDPADVEAAAELAHAAIRGGDLEAGMRYVEAGRQAAPDDPRIQASLAALMLAIGMNDRAEQTLDAALAASPDLARGWLWRGVLYSGQGRSEEAAAAFERVLELSDDAEDRRLAVVMSADGSGAGTAGSAPAPAMPAAAATAPSTGAPARVTGRLRFADGASAPAGALVFIYARPSAEGRGPPLAALKLPASGIPLEFQLGDADIIMQGSTWPDQVWLSARIDTDGNAMTREDGAPAAAPVGPVSGPDPVELVLQ